MVTIFNLNRSPTESAFTPSKPVRAFLKATEHNLVPKGSFLLVESLDRLSRDQILSAQSLFLQIVQAGVTIVTLVDQRSYSIESLNRNPIDLIISLVVMMRANVPLPDVRPRRRDRKITKREDADFHGVAKPSATRSNWRRSC